jgi:bifunctional non-homologous end joining protein LigD
MKRRSRGSGRKAKARRGEPEMPKRGALAKAMNSGNVLAGNDGFTSMTRGAPYRSGRSPHWVKVKNPKARAVRREAEEDWGR